MDPSDNYNELLKRIKTKHYYCHPDYIKLHEMSLEIVDVYLVWRKTESKESGAEIGRLIDRWVATFDAVPYKERKIELPANDICAICLETPAPGTSVRKCENNHVFCEGCMIDLFIDKKESKYSESPSCPTCRGTINFGYSTHFCVSTKNVITNLSNPDRLACDIPS